MCCNDLTETMTLKLFKLRMELNLSQLSSFCLFALCSRYGLLNVIVFVIGFLSNLNGGFRGSWAYPFAKAMFVIGTKSQRIHSSVGYLYCEFLMQGGGYSMDLNFAMLVLPTLKSLQTATRRAFHWWTVVVLSCCRQSFFFLIGA